jgi:hypothetical protein
MRTKIEKGDIVHVNFNNAQFTLCSEARVESIPSCIGDSWIFYDLKTGELHYVGEPCTITLKSNHNK